MNRKCDVKNIMYLSSIETYNKGSNLTKRIFIKDASFIINKGELVVLVAQVVLAKEHFLYNRLCRRA